MSASFVSVAAADDITVINHTADTIYKLYAWPDEMAAHTLNLLGFPLVPNVSTTIDIDNSYGDCLFMIEINPNDPAAKKKLFNPRKDIVLNEYNLCQSKGGIDLQPPAEDF